ncbi:MAG: right-handed parallel beta-helix repeat-containing protein [Candidatus Cloacimonetes bacterium]|nr:right-handed parallel beta-helix repeat-containing protein [Candidatus Cloacimonadota bacterium]
MRKQIILLIFMFMTIGALAITINIPEDYPTIQLGINASDDGDEIIAAPGTYVENIDFNGKAVILGSLFYTTQDTSYISQTIIDGNQNGSVVTFENDEDSTSVLTGFSITNGQSYAGGGINCIYSSPSLENLTIMDNSAEYYGGGIHCDSSSPRLENVTIRDNVAYYGSGIYCRENSSPSLENLTIMDNLAGIEGGGIYCRYSSSPSLENVTISDNSANRGGGIYCRYFSNPSLENVTITGNSAESSGGGIYCRENSSPGLANVTITDNSADCGGGIWCHESVLILENVTITNNSAGGDGGGIFFFGSSLNLEVVKITENSAGSEGGGIYCDYSSLSLENVTITGNSAIEHGGGMSCLSSNSVFSSENRCNIYLNNTSNRGYGSDIYSYDCIHINVIVDTFTVANPTDFHAFPIGIFTFNILHGLQEQVNADLFVSPEGLNSNSGLTIDDPLQTIQYDCSIILANESDPHTIYLSEGTYSPSINDEFFPVNIPDFVSLCGESETGVILDAEGTAGVIRLYNTENVTISDLTITNGHARLGGGIYCREDSSPSLENVTITSNSAEDSGGGLYCWHSSPSLENVIISDNSANEMGGGIYCLYSSDVSLENVMITDNSAEIYGGGIYCFGSSPSLAYVTISNNSAGYYGGGIYSEYSSPVFSGESRCNIYLNNTNNRGNGSDIYSDSNLYVIVDTFTVSNPTDFHATPIQNFTFDILQGFQEQVNADLFVSPEGLNSNSGLTIDDPLQTIQYACSIIFANESDPHTINLLEGTYSPSINSEFFPVNIPDFVSLCGESETGVILDAEGTAGVIWLYNTENVTISDLTITNGHARLGGGINCREDSSPSLENVTITSNSAEDSGGGIYCRGNSSPSLENVTITDNSAGIEGGGLYCWHSSPSLENVIISDNSADEMGGGIFCRENSSPSLENVTISNNSADEFGGGIYSEYSSPVFSSENRCNIYLNNTNNRNIGSDIYSDSNLYVIVDTFTVSNPTDFHATPIQNFTFDILQGLQEQINANLFVSPSGNNSNTGLTLDDPLQTIQYACSVILANSQNHHTIYLEEGTYSPSINAEYFPINLPDYVSLAGYYEDTVILDAEGAARVIRFHNAVNVAISYLTITNGYAMGEWPECNGGGIYCYSSSPILRNVTITENSAVSGGGIFCSSSNPSLENVMITDNSVECRGGGIYCWENSRPGLVNVTISGNSADDGGGIFCNHSSNPSFENVIITNNSAESRGGGIFGQNSSCLNLENVTISNNLAESGGGIYCCASSPSLENATITNNSADYGGGIYCSFSNPTLVNSIFWNNLPQEVEFYHNYDPLTITIAYSDIEGGEEGIETNNNGTVNWLEGNIDADPLFVDAELGNYNLTEDSPCIDAGTSYFEYGGEVLVDLSDDEYYGSAPDMGAYESPYTSNEVDDLEPMKDCLTIYPNPFNPETNILFELSVGSNALLEIYNIKGQKVITLVNEPFEAGSHQVTWNAENYGSGIYLLKFITAENSETKKLILLK